MQKGQLDDVSGQLTPSEVLAYRIAMALGGGRREIVPRWARDQYSAEAQMIVAVLEGHGITDETISTAVQNSPQSDVAVNPRSIDPAVN